MEISLGTLFINLFLPWKMPQILQNVSLISHSARCRSSGVHSGQRLRGKDHPEVERASADLRDHHSVRGTTNTRVNKMLRGFRVVNRPTFNIKLCFLSSSLWIVCISVRFFESVFPQLWWAVVYSAARETFTLIFFFFYHVFWSLGLGIRCIC